MGIRFPGCGDEVRQRMDAYLGQTAACDSLKRERRLSSDIAYAVSRSGVFTQRSGTVTDAPGPKT